MQLFRLLEHEGNHATVVDNGAKALDLLRGEPFDLVLVDLPLAGDGDPGLVEAIKTDPGLQHIPLIVTAAAPDGNEVSRCLELGADDVIPKPVDGVILALRVRTALTKKRLQEVKADYEEGFRRVSAALATIGREAFDSSALEAMSRRRDPAGQLARAVLEMAVRLPAREHT